MSEASTIRSMVAGDRVIYDGPTEGPYFPAAEVGTVIHVGPKRASVRFEWGVHYLRLEHLLVVGVGQLEAA